LTRRSRSRRSAKGSLVATLVTRDPRIAAKAVPIAAAWHGRILVLDREAAAESTGHGSPLPQLKHGGPGRAGGGEELGGIRAVNHYLQRAAVQGSPTMVAAVTGEYVRGAALREGDVHPFRKHFEELAIGDSLLTHRRTVERGRHRQLRRHLGRLLLHALRRDRGARIGVRQAHRPWLLRAVGGGRAVRLAGRRDRCSRTTASTRCASSSRSRSATRSGRASPAKRKIDRNRKDAKGVGQGVVAWDVEVTEPGWRRRCELRHPDPRREEVLRPARPMNPPGKPLRAARERAPKIVVQSHMEVFEWSRPAAPAPSQPGPTGSAVGPRVLKKYPNRRLYDTKISSYITLADVKSMVLSGIEFEVRDAKTGET
jgi:hypothetical protein